MSAHTRPRGQQPPISRWQPSRREYPSALPKPEYPGHHLVRLVSNAGTCRFKARQLFLSQALKQDYVGLEETGDGIWSIYFYDLLLGKLDERTFPRAQRVQKTLSASPGRANHRARGAAHRRLHDQARRSRVIGG